ncbi:MAG: ribonuclease HIII [Candidatus Aenigmarchaeota archaeon]|nr:ribonuclease HIII [Candidatus Aenigmarchaeota archaeon]
MKRIGVDESGKGDYFGYLVTCGVLVTDETALTLAKLKVKDSKLLSDATVLRLAPKIKKICPLEVVKVSPDAYNRLYVKFKSLNILLAWSHARVIENLLEKHTADQVTVDKFADEKILNNILFERGKKAKIIQKVRAESEIEVAAASVVARAEFLRTLHVLSHDVGYLLPKGSTHVIADGKKIIQLYGKEMLPHVAKMHFKCTKKILGT